MMRIIKAVHMCTYLSCLKKTDMHHNLLTNTCKWKGLGFLCVALALSLLAQNGTLLLHHRHSESPEHHHSFPITRGHVIALYPESTPSLLADAGRHLGISNMSVFRAINGSEAMDMGGVEISLYTQYLMLSGFQPSAL
jgi:hypothetical protein